ncbi:MAG: restriction endonuclease [Syntrophobacteraceae bacterium]
MSQIDLREIPSSAPGHLGQDIFELFARDFLKALGFEVVAGPDRGADSGRDIIVQEKVSGLLSSEVRRWLVSVKHFAHSGRSVGLGHERNIVDRMRHSHTYGFIGFYSTVPSSSLSNRLEEIIRDKFHIYDSGYIIGALLNNDKLSGVLKQYCPKAYRAIMGLETRHQLILVTELDLQPYNDDEIEINLADLLDLSEDGYLHITEPDIGDIMTACVLAEAFRKGRFNILRIFTSFRPLVWNYISTLISNGRINKEQLIADIRGATDTSYLRLLISLAGSAGISEAVGAICQITLSRGRIHQANTRQFSVPVTPFFDVVRYALRQMPEPSVPLIQEYCERARNLKKWHEKKVFEKGAER